MRKSTNNNNNNNNPCLPLRVFALLLFHVHHGAVSSHLLNHDPESLGFVSGTASLLPAARILTFSTILISSCTTSLLPSAASRLLRTTPRLWWLVACSASAATATFPMAFGPFHATRKWLSSATLLCTTILGSLLARVGHLHPDLDPDLPPPSVPRLQHLAHTHAILAIQSLPDIADRIGMPHPPRDQARGPGFPDDPGGADATEHGKRLLTGRRCGRTLQVLGEQCPIGFGDVEVCF